MARIKGLGVTNLQGRLGNMVFRNRGGENIVSQRPASVKNPRTEGQQLQRAILNTVVQAYSALQFICDHSFAGKTYGAKSMEYFMKTNLDALRNQPEASRPLIGKGNRSIAPFRFMVSDGNLPSIDFSAESNGARIDFGSNATATLGQFMTAIKAEPGDQITFAFAFRKNISPFDVANSKKQYATLNTTYVRYTLKSTYTDAELNTALNGPSGYLNSSLFAETVGTSLVSAAVNSEGALLVVPDGHDEEEGILFAAVILSRKSGDTWQRSRQFLDCSEINVANISYSAVDVLPTYDPSSPYYLNNADK